MLRFLVKGVQPHGQLPDKLILGQRAVVVLIDIPYAVITANIVCFGFRAGVFFFNPSAVPDVFSHQRVIPVKQSHRNMTVNLAVLFFRELKIARVRRIEKRLGQLAAVRFALRSLRSAHDLYQRGFAFFAFFCRNHRFTGHKPLESRLAALGRQLDNVVFLILKGYGAVPVKRRPDILAAYDNRKGFVMLSAVLTAGGKDKQQKRGKQKR